MIVVQLVMAALLLFTIGFLAFAFLWRWWLLLPAAAIGAAVAAIEGGRFSSAEGFEAGLMGAGLIIVVFGAVGGVVASAAMIAGRESPTVRAIVVLPVCFMLGVASYLGMAFLL